MSEVGALPIAVDVMGADKGTEEMVLGALDAVRSINVSCILVGDKDEIQAILKNQEFPEERVSVEHAPQVITMHDSPVAAVRAKPESSISISYDLIQQGRASAVVSPGNTGAFMAAGRVLCGTLPGIGRPAIASFLPRLGELPPLVLVDSGASVDCHAHQLVQFALMGRIYAELATGRKSPRVALLSNGTEQSKGNDITRAAAAVLTELKGMNFVGYIEGTDLGGESADVVVCDGFVGNVVLKTMEGTARLVFASIREKLMCKSLGRLAMWLAKGELRALYREKMDPSTYGGAPLLGLTQVAIVCHGSSDRRAIENGIGLASKFVKEGFIETMREALTALELETLTSYDQGYGSEL